MKIKIIKLFCLIVSVVTLAACGNPDILKTKKATEKLTQTEVILETDTETTEQYKNFNKSFSPDFTVPGLLEGVIPQGLCYDPKEDNFVISGYYENEEYPSVIMIVDGKSSKMTAYHPLKNMDGTDYIGHAGGIAASNGYIFISSDSECYVFSLEALQNTESGQAIQFTSKFRLWTKGSFAGISDGILWFGDFIESDDKAKQGAERITTLDSGETFYAYCEGYTLEEGLPSVKKINSSSNGYIPDYFLAIPEQVQGMAVTKTDKLVFTSSYGRKNDSYIYIFEDVFLSEKTETITIDEQSVDLYACSSQHLSEKIIAPPMIEGITTKNGELCTIFESGAAKYRQGGGKHPVDKAFKAIIE